MCLHQACLSAFGFVWCTWRLVLSPGSYLVFELTLTGKYIRNLSGGQETLSEYLTTDH